VLQFLPDPEREAPIAIASPGRNELSAGRFLFQKGESYGIPMGGREGPSVQAQGRGLQRIWGGVMAGTGGG